MTDPGNHPDAWWLDHWNIPTVQTRQKLMLATLPHDQQLQANTKRKQMATPEEGLAKKGAVKKAKLEPQRSRKRRGAAGEEEEEAAAPSPGAMIKILKVEGGAEEIVIKEEPVDVVEEEEVTAAEIAVAPVLDMSRLEMSPFEATKSYMCAFCPKRYCNRQMFCLLFKTMLLIFGGIGFLDSEFENGIVFENT